MNAVTVTDDVAIAAQRWRKRVGLRRFVNICVVAAILVCAYYLITPYCYLSWNYSESLDGHLYAVNRMQKDKFAIGDYISFMPPKNPYYPKTAWFTKIAIAGPGDVISHTGRTVLINGVPIGRALERDTAGRRKLVMISDGPIPAGYLFMWTPHPHSYDSRYAEIGLVPNERIVGRAYRLF